MTLLDRLILTVFSLVAIGVSIVIMLFAAGWTIPLDYINLAATDLSVRWGTGLVGFVGLLGGLHLLFINFRGKKVDHTLVQETSMGKVQVSVEAIENLVQRAARQVEGVRDVKPVISCLEHGIMISLQVIISPEQSIPFVTRELQQVVKDQVQQIMGVDVLEIKVLVSNIVKDVRSRVE